MTAPPRSLVLGTAGHIDHGKSTLVKALTGTDPDRLKEEKERGITIDLGFAFLTLPNGASVGIVDVPGHEKLIRNMLAGVGGIDLVMLVVAADEGIMPQTREHLAICDLLGIPRGLVAVTKTDLVEPEWLALVTDEVRRTVRGTFLEDAPIVPVSSKTGAGLPRLVETIQDLAADIRTRPADGPLRLPIDRVFTVKGFGTVVTGTLISGRLREEETVVILPAGLSSRVRGLQTHGLKAAEIAAGQRAAVNLQGVEKDQVERGDVLARPGQFKPSRLIDVRLRLLKGAPAGIKMRSRVRIHLGTAEAMGRVVLFPPREIAPGDSSYAQIRLESPLVAASGDRFIIRRYSPVETLGGGIILDPTPVKHRLREEGLLPALEKLHAGSLADRLAVKVHRAGLSGIDRESLAAFANLSRKETEAALAQIVQAGTVLMADKESETFIHRGHVEDLKDRIVSAVSAFHRDNPLKPGIPKEELRGRLGGGLPLRLLNKTLDLLARDNRAAVDRDLVRLPDFGVRLGGAETDTIARIVALYREAGTQPPLREELPGKLGTDAKTVADLLRQAASRGDLVRINDSLYFHREAYESIRRILRETLAARKELTVAEMRDAIGTTRKFAVPLAEHLDSAKFTLRVGDKRRLMETTGGPP
ncbi:MAG: selenocysteine-specific translation elongation factor [Nitrospirae bacterium RBG_16_64_22]|nr:MAG: selenocysteine-specific translation elongation factor [Nitrospirae bacterium RBG_16_64_22]